MDTISRENNPSILPIAGVIVGALALVLSVVALVKTGPIKQIRADLDGATAKIDTAASDARAASEAANKANGGIANLQRSVQGAFDQVTAELGNLKTEMNKLATAKAAPAPKGPKGEKGEAGPGGDYTIKAGDYPAKIAREHGVSLDALMAANPGLDAKHLKVGQKINLPKGK